MAVRGFHGEDQGWETGGGLKQMRSQGPPPRGSVRPAWATPDGRDPFNLQPTTAGAGELAIRA